VSQLNHKLVRDVWRMRYQVLTIALVLGCGLASFIATTAAHASLAASRDAFYRNTRFADVFAHLGTAPDAVLDQLRDIPGVAAVEGRLVGDYRVELDAVSDPLSVQLVSLAWPADARINQPQLRAGHQLTPGRADEVLVNEIFAQTWQLKPGATISVIIEGRRAQLRVAGIAISPEFVWGPFPRSGFPDPRRYGAMWMNHDAMAKTMGKLGAFNDATFILAVAADPEEVVHRIDAVLAPYGGGGAFLRADQPSNKTLDQKIASLQRMARSVPLLFLAVAVFLLNVLVSRIVGSQREQIATLKAIGFRTIELLQHFLEFTLAICLVGVVIGFGLGIAGAKGLMLVYQSYFRFSSYEFRFDGSALFVATLVTLLASFAGTFWAVRKAVAIAPAEAMRPEPPPNYRRSRFEAIYNLLPPAARMVFRDMARRPIRLALSAGSIALATSIVVAGGVINDSMTTVLRLQFEVLHREDLTVTLDRARSRRALDEVAHIPGVRYVEGERILPVRLRVGIRTRATVIAGVQPSADLHRMLDAQQQPLRLPPNGLALSRPLANALAIAPGAIIDVELLEPGRRRLLVPMTAIVDDILGMTAYMDAAALANLLDETPRVSTILVATDPGQLDAVSLRLNALPAVAAVNRPALDRALVQAQISDEFVVMQILLSMFAAAIAIGVVYNNARIALELRSRDLATLRILGFTRGELAVVLLGEQAVQIVLGVVGGLFIGKRMGAVVIASVDREMIRVPVLLSFASYAVAICVVLLAALASALLVRRRADRLDLVAVLKARD
jgi:putative ABC transport system permease protein